MTTQVGNELGLTQTNNMAKKIYYKIVQQTGDEIFTLFHGINGTKKLQRGVWITAEIKENVMDGLGTKYTSGIHIVDGLEEAKDYAKNSEGQIGSSYLVMLED